ncbi:LytR/AlgR family response regulator transcription factor [Sphingobacterium psychroaquaticum]|uniref:Two component transcriptional regulator, LytTR family n=1 Tax=Sphingobacterium psychroaquaticum TaxID=561061 RepID=A0A1X7ILU1_9SPHI|nr:LytTR family DNA-binding domain-containing protein [Sphingobacterium psychroaquaticum]SMG15874.1 two component transcriptional regulator, LytTR family [Sphingobacterium psychroaquaticum]
MTCIIIDDEPLAREELEHLIGEASDLKILGCFPNAKQARLFMETNHIDLIFLDIEMPGTNGLQFAEHIGKNTLVIFTTAYPQYALKSYELDAIDYLVKPIEHPRLEKAIAKAKSYHDLLKKSEVNNTIVRYSEGFLLVRSERQYRKVFIKDILFIEGLKDYVVIHEAPSEKIITAMNLKSIHQKLPDSLFVRVSKSYIVNVAHVDRFDSQTIFINDTEIPLGEVYRKKFFDVWDTKS